MQRPVVKRTYRSRKSATTVELQPAPSTKLANLQMLDDEGSSAAVDASSSDGPSVPTSTPPTSPRTTASTSRSHSDNNSSSSQQSKRPTSLAAQGNKSDLRSFFQPVSPPRRKRARTASPPPLTFSVNDENVDPGQGSTLTAPSRPDPSSSRPFSLFGNISADNSLGSKSKRPKAPKKMEQMYLDPFETGGHSTLSCNVCSLSYSRTPEDMSFHDKHHKRVVGGCEWISAEVERKLVGEAKVQVVEQDVDCGNGLKGRISIVDAKPGGTLERRVNDILSTVDAQLSSSALTNDQLSDCKLVVLVTSQRKVVACAVVQRISEAFQIELETTSAATGSDKRREAMIRFGEDEGAIFCSPTPVPVVLGIQRIWTSSTFRRKGFATRLLDAAAARCIYGCPIPQQRRALDVAFSQPTGKGQALARAWTGTNEFRVFVD
ncbi:hypothetical protein ACM66B_002912 [Microbotryomycetes sp. NB124-2]